jgi:metal-responsive CopG/Arc/MetJ family transcriptional regulator
MLTQTFNISLPKDLVKKADIVAKREYRNRSELIKEALRTYLLSKQNWEEIFAYGKGVGDKLGIKSEQEVFDLIDGYRNGR